MANDIPMDVPIPADVPVEGEALVEEPGTEMEDTLTQAEEQPTGSIMSHTREEIPELEGKAIGDLVSFRITGVSEDGNTFDMEFSPLGGTEEPAVMPEEAPIGGREAIVNALS